MDVWSSQSTTDDRTGDDDEDYELPENGKDALIVLIDARTSMFAPYEPSAADTATTKSAPPTTWFHAVVDLAAKLLKAKVIANDNSLISVVFFGSRKRTEASSLESVYEFQSLGFPTAARIKELQSLVDTPADDAQLALESMSATDALPISNALWHCGIAFSNANLNKKDAQRVWLFTNDDAPMLPDADERGRVQKQVQNHVELKRTLNLFTITPSKRESFDLQAFYACAFHDFTADPSTTTTTAVDGSLLVYQPAFAVDSLADLTEGSLRKRFRKRRVTSFGFSITPDVAIGVELYALAVVQRKAPPIALDAVTNAPLKSETKWLCEDTGAYLTPDQIKRFIDYGGKRIYLSRDDVVQLKYFDAPGLQLLCFVSADCLLADWHANVRAPYFLYPSDALIANSTTAFHALLTAMETKHKVAIARLIARKSSEPRLVALIPQREVADELGQVQPTGFHVIFLPYLDDIRDIPVETRERATHEQVDAAKALIQKLTLSDVPSFENPELQKHYASVQALALGEDELQFDETSDTTLPDQEGFAQPDVQDAILAFRDVCGGDAIDKSTLKRKSATPPARKTTAKKSTSDDGGDLSKDHWQSLVASGAVQKKLVKDIKAFLQAHDIAAIGNKKELIDKVCAFVNE